MRKNRFSREPEVDPFYDMLFNMLIAFVFCFIIALLAMNPKATKTGDIPAKAEFIITLSWPDMDPNDLDLWVQGPSGESVWFRNREVDLMYLDRDDRGNSNNTIMVNGRKVINPLRQEVVTIRSIVPGEYVVNAHYYETKDIDSSDPRAGQPVEVNLSVIKVNPKAEVVFYGQATLEGRGKEATLARFTVTPEGGVDNVNTIPKTLVKSF
ncbi:MAG: hypothetical protein EBT67_01145 [Betaproteobacteria bacterium]|jgi:hypothetical protein|nr:hypothetical protein [Betaproteobacteria bacterium]